MSIKKISGYLQNTFNKVSVLLHAIARTAPFHLLGRYKDRAAMCLYFLWLTGCGYWFYLLITIEARPMMNWMIITNDPKEALAFLLLGAFGLVYILFFVIFIVKLIYNLFHEGMQSITSDKWYSLTKSISYLLLLGLAFSYTENIKAVGLTAYTQVDHIINTSMQNESMAEKRASQLKDLMQTIEHVFE